MVKDESCDSKRGKSNEVWYHYTIFQLQTFDLTTFFLFLEKLNGFHLFTTTRALASIVYWFCYESLIEIKNSC